MELAERERIDDLRRIFKHELDDRECVDGLRRIFAHEMCELENVNKLRQIFRHTRESEHGTERPDANRRSENSKGAAARTTRSEASAA